MIESLGPSESRHEDNNEISLFALGNVFLRRRRMILGFAVAGAMLGVATGLRKPAVYKSNAIFVPQATDGAPSGLSSVASQFGIRVPTSGSGSWGPPIYVELLKSRMMLEPIALDTLTVPEKGGRRIAIMDLLEIHAPSRELRPMLTVTALGKMITATEDTKLNLVRISVETRWPSVSRTLADRLVRGVNQFNLEKRKSQAVAEREFVDRQSAEAELALRQAEDQLQLFLLRNRAIGGSPELAFERDRLQRQVSLRQQIYTTLLQSREEARIRAVRDVPVITILEDPRLPLTREPRGTLKRGFLGGLAGLLVGILGAFAAHGMAAARRSSDAETTEFLRLIDDITPRFLKRTPR